MKKLNTFTGGILAALTIILFCAASLPDRFTRAFQVIVQPRNSTGGLGSNVFEVYDMSGSNGFKVATNGYTVVVRNGTNNPVLGGTTALGSTNFTLAKTNQVFVIRDGRIVAIE